MQGGTKRLFLSLSILALIAEKSPQIAILLGEVEENLKEKAASTVKIPLDDKKSLMVNTFVNKAYVTIETYKDRVVQPALGFSFDHSEWTSFMSIKDGVQESVQQIQAGPP